MVAGSAAIERLPTSWIDEAAETARTLLFGGSHALSPPSSSSRCSLPPGWPTTGSLRRHARPGTSCRTSPSASKTFTTPSCRRRWMRRQPAGARPRDRRRTDRTRRGRSHVAALDAVRAGFAVVDGRLDELRRQHRGRLDRRGHTDFGDIDRLHDRRQSRRRSTFARRRSRDARRLRGHRSPHVGARSAPRQFVVGNRLPRAVRVELLGSRRHPGRRRPQASDCIFHSKARCSCR